MFHANRWARAFTNACGENSEEAFLFLKAVSPRLELIKDSFSGSAAAANLEKALLQSVEAAGSEAVDKTQALNYSIRFLALLTARKKLKYIGSVIEEIGQELDKKNRRLGVVVQTAAPMDSAFEEELKNRIIERTGVSAVTMKVTVVPELLGGLRLNMDGYYIDASLKTQMQKMIFDLGQADHTQTV